MTLPNAGKRPIVREPTLSYQCRSCGQRVYLRRMGFLGTLFAAALGLREDSWWCVACPDAERARGQAMQDASVIHGSTSIDDLDLPAKVRTSLMVKASPPLRTVRDLYKRTESQLLAGDDFGPMSLLKVKRELCKLGLNLRPLQLVHKKRLAP